MDYLESLDRRELIEEVLHLQALLQAYRQAIRENWKSGEISEQLDTQTSDRDELSPLSQRQSAVVQP